MHIDFDHVKTTSIDVKIVPLKSEHFGTNLTGVHNQTNDPYVVAYLMVSHVFRYLIFTHVHINRRFQINNQ